MNSEQHARCLRDEIADLDNSVPRGYLFLGLLVQICREARIKHTQDTNYCSYAWANSERYQKRMFDCIRRLRRHEKELKVLWPGSALELQNDPRGYAVRVTLPNGRGSCMAGGVGVA